MKRIAFKYTLSLIIIAALSGSLIVFLIFYSAKRTVNSNLLFASKSSVEKLSLALKRGEDRKSIQKTLNELTKGSGDILHANITNTKGDVLIGRSLIDGHYKTDFLVLSHKIKYDGQTYGTLRIYPTHEFIYRIVFGDSFRKTLYILGFLWLSIIAGAVYLFLKSKLLKPIGKMYSYLDSLEKDELINLDFGPGFSEWNTIETKLNELGERTYDSNASLHMLFAASQTIISRFEIDHIFKFAMDIIQKKFEGVSCSILMLEDDGFLRIKNNISLSPNFVKSVKLRVGEGFAGKAFETCQTVLVNDIDEEEQFIGAKSVLDEGIKSFIHIPLVVESRCEGILNVNSLDKDYFTDKRVDSVANIAEYLTIALRNSKLYRKIQELNRRLETEVSTTTRELIQTNSKLIQKVREMKVLSDISVFAASRVNLTEILSMIIDKMKELLLVQTGGFFLHSQESNELVPYSPFFGIKDKDFSRLHFKLSENKSLNEIIKTGKHCVFNNSNLINENLPLLTSLLSISSLALVPLKTNNRTIGVLGVANKFGLPFKEDDIHILKLIADRVSGFIENVRLYHELQLNLHDLTALQEIASAISSEPVWDDITQKIISTITESFDADLCALLLFDDKTNELVTLPGAYFTGGDEAVLLRIPVNDPNSLSAQVFRSGESFLSPDASIDPNIKSQTARLWDVRSLILVPLRAENRVTGVLRIGKHKANTYNKQHLGLAAMIAHQAAVIIENAKLYDSLKETKLELERLNRIKNEFISMVSHELRTPITAIKGFVKVVLDEETGPLDVQQKKFLKIADQSIDRLIILISDLLDISKIESGQISMKLSIVDPMEVSKIAVNNLMASAKNKKIALINRIPKKIPKVVADKDRLIQVFDNLVSNSIKFTAFGGSITISAQDKGDFVLFAVSDTGVGIERKDWSKIFDKFYQVDSSSTRSSSGAGLGLAIAKSIVEYLGGKIWVESEIQKGSDFKFLVPRAKTEINDFHLEEQELRKADRQKNKK